MNARPLLVALLLLTASACWAGTNLNSSKSNLNRLTYDTAVVSPQQAILILKDLDAIPRADEAKVRQVLRSRGINAPNLLIRIVPAGQRREKLPAILILKDAADEAQAIAVSDPGHDPPKKSTK